MDWRPQVHHLVAMCACVCIQLSSAPVCGALVEKRVKSLFSFRTSCGQVARQMCHLAFTKWPLGARQNALENRQEGGGLFHLRVGAVLTQHSSRGWGSIFHLPCWACVNIAYRICVALYCVVLFCVVLCCVVLYVVLCCFVLCCLCCFPFVLCCVLLCFVVLFSFCVVLCCVVLCCAVLCCVVLCCVVLCCVVLCCVVLCCVVLCCGTSVEMVYDLLHYLACLNVPASIHPHMRCFVEILHKTVYNIKMKWEPGASSIDWCDARMHASPIVILP